MDYYEEDTGASGSIPEFGAIFMSNVETKKEFFKRKIFALPSSKAEFVKQIKAGMVLFLFEFKKRQLFGVYQASSDGAMDIVPHAFHYPGKRFPAQVCFTPIWHCGPLSEKEFRDAIRENYFSAKKFNFGLSEDQVRRLLYLFSSRKLKNKMTPHPLSEVIVGVAGKDRRLVGDDRLVLTERGYIEPAEYDEFNPAAFHDHHADLLARAEEDEVLVDVGANTEGKVYPYSEEDFLAKRRRIGNDDRLIANGVAENEIYDHHTLQASRIYYPKDSLDEVRRLADPHWFRRIENENENQVDKILNRSECLVDPLDVKASDDYRFRQRSRLIDEYNMKNGSGRAFASDRYGKSFDKIKHAIDDDMFFFDDSVQRDYDNHVIVKPLAYGDSNLSLSRQARDLIDDRECLMNRQLEKRYHLDCDGRPISAFDHSARLLHNIRKTTAAGRLPIHEGESDFGTFFAEGFSSENFSQPLQCGQRIIHDRSHPVVEGRLNEHMVDNIFCSASLAKDAGYSLSVDRRAVDGERIRKSERTDNEEDGHLHSNAVMSMEYPSFSQLKQNLPSLSDKSTEKGLPQFSVSQNLDLSRSRCDDATITRVVPYSPEHPNLSHGWSASIAANQNSSLVRENNPHHCSLGNFYSLSKNRLPPYLLESEKSSRPLGITPEFGNQGFPTSTSRHQRSLFHESCSSFVNSSSSMHMDLKTSAAVNYRASLCSNLSPQCADLENIGREKGFFAYDYPSESRENHFEFDGNLPAASLRVNKHIPQHEMDMLAGKDFSCSEAKDLAGGVCYPERDLTSHENQYFRLSSNMKLKELHKISEAPDATSNVNRRSVFTRLTSRKESQFGEEKNANDFNHHNCYMEATADEVMEMVQHGDNLSLRKLRKSRAGGQPTHGENAINEKKTQCHIESSYSTMEKNKLNDASLATAEHKDKVLKETQLVDFKCRTDRKKISIGITADSDAHSIVTNHATMVKNKQNDASLATADCMDEVPKETRMVDFKRRTDRKKTLVGITADSDAQNKITGADEGVENSMKANLKRKKLVRPIFSEVSFATDATCDNETSQIPAPILDKDDKRSCETAISIHEAEMPNDSTGLSNVLTSRPHQPMDCNDDKRQNPEGLKDEVAHVLPSTSLELKGHETANVDLQIGSSQILKETTKQKSFGIQTSAQGILSKDIDTTITGLNLPESSVEGFRVGAGCVKKLIDEKH